MYILSKIYIYIHPRSMCKSDRNTLQAVAKAVAGPQVVAVLLGICLDYLEEEHPRGGTQGSLGSPRFISHSSTVGHLEGGPTALSVGDIPNDHHGYQPRIQPLGAHPPSSFGG